MELVLGGARGVLQHNSSSLQYLARFILGKLFADEMVGNELQKVSVDRVSFNELRRPSKPLGRGNQSSLHQRCCGYHRRVPLFKS
jgi:hypothetical protein